MSVPRLSYATKQAIIADYTSGMKIAAIASKYGCHESYPGLLARRNANRKTAKKYEPKAVMAS
ncbi:hypothetical protein G6L12_05715 [Agrobacterium rhizogenes]|nr:hypothetical protein [Rhizobium rhizogenes]NTF73972.1 hypothetical protein [Rhizobium rhizogenes]